MATESLSEAPEEWGDFLRPCMFSGLRGVDVGDEPAVNLGDGFLLVKANPWILSARTTHSMTGKEFLEAADASRYLVYQHDPPVPGRTYDEIKNIFYCGMLALQVLKPVETLGLAFYGDYTPSGSFLLQVIERRPPMEPGPWALERRFDLEFLPAFSRTIAGIKAIMNGSQGERKNAVILLQLGLEHFHPLIAGLLWTAGLDAIFDSGGAQNFKNDLSAYLGAQTAVFPAWHAQRRPWTVDGVAADLYTLRNKLVHGVDLRKAALDKFPVDLIGKRTLPDLSDPVPYALLLSEAASYLLCQVLQKEITLL